MKVIFLDVDGVLNCIGWLKKHEGESYDQNSIDSSKVELLAEIIDRTGAKVVLSSTWRHIRGHDENPRYPMFDYLVDTLRKCDIEIMDYTPLINDDRPKEIRAWLNDAPFEIESFVSLDDDFREKDYQKQGIFRRLIHTTYWDMDGGLKQEHVERAVKLLNE